MRRVLVTMLACAVLAACGGNDGDDVGSGDDTVVTESTPDVPAETQDDSDDTSTAGALVIDSDTDETCDAQQAAEISGTDLDVSLSGECGEVTIQGEDNDVDVDSADALTVEGSDHDVDVDSVRNVTVTGNDNDVDIGGSVELLVVEGSDHDIECDGSAAEINDSSSDSDIEC